MNLRLIFAFLLLFSISEISIVICDEITIHNASELITFSNQVNYGASFEGTTIFLGSDIYFTDELSFQQFYPIGLNYNSYFKGYFDGQGHVISNLTISSALPGVGLFGYSQGSTIIKNVVIDKTCTFESTRNTESSLIGGILGYCYAINGHCILENNVNMASLIFTGNVPDYVYIGGISGQLYYQNENENIVRNCVNYGPVTYNGTAAKGFILGGIVGEFYWSRISNCLNYGTITHDGVTSTYEFIGGIVGKLRDAVIENCISAGYIVSSEGTVGGIVGNVQASTGANITHCYWTNDVKCTKYVGGGGVVASSSTQSSQIDLESDLVNDLNEYSSDDTWSKWLFNKNNDNITFKIGDEKGFSLSSQLILLPSLADSICFTFDGWYSDSGYLNKLVSYEVSEELTFYSKLIPVNYTVTFNTRGGSSIATITSQYGSIVQLPNDSVKSNNDCTISFWRDEDGDKVSWNFTIPSHDTTLYAVWFCTRIKTTEELIDFSMNVNDGTCFEGSTVFLDSDIDFTPELSLQFDPIGREWNKYFRGTFDAQGHVISNLAINTILPGVGLFGYSHGETTIRNVVIDESCSVISSSTSQAYVGGVIGSCHAHNGACTFESNVNMANLAFNGYVANYTYMGGISGQLYHAVTNEVTIKNCVNYGSITCAGNSGLGYMIGGIVGEFYDKYLLNSLNYGTIEFKGLTSGYVVIGGVAGKTWNCTIENCVSAGKIASSEGFVGGIVGNIQSNVFTRFVECYLTSGTECPKAIGMGEENSNANASQVEVSLDIVDKLNNHSSYNSWSKWLFNPNNNTVTFKVSEGKGFSLSSQMILLPDLSESIGYTFNGWYKDPQYLNKFTATEISTQISLYARYTNVYTVTFMSDGQLVQRQELVYGDEILRPNEQSKVGHTFVGWDNNVNTMPNFDITINAIFMPNNYTVAFDFDNGTVIEVEFSFNETIDYPKDAERKGYIIVGWNTSDIFMPDHNTSAKAVWNKITEFVEIVLSTKDMSKNEFTAFIKEFTDAAFDIIEFETESGETRVVIKFVDKEEGKAFVRELNKSVEENYVGIIKRTEFILVDDQSFSLAVYPLFALLI